MQPWHQRPPAVGLLHDVALCTMRIDHRLSFQNGLNARVYSPEQHHDSIKEKKETNQSQANCQSSLQVDPFAQDPQWRGEE